MSTPQDARFKAATTYNAAADFYDDPANSFWERFGRRTIERLQLCEGERLLDVCCGTGASAIPAAEIVGERGLVVGVDLAESLLELARTKAKRMGLSNIDFQRGDILDLSFNDSTFDAVVCVFGIFFVPDMTAAVRELWRVVKPGGKLAITTWGARFFEPASTVFWNSIRDVRPDLYKGFNPWDRICDPQSLGELLKDAGVSNVDTVAESGVHHIPTPEAWWSAVLGSGYRGTVEQLDTDAREHVRTANYHYIRESGPLDVEANVVYAIARKS
jgi:ubiquinone/menaquinone biosynthesis C-methylase UbiE